MSLSALKALIIAEQSDALTVAVVMPLLANQP
jgi:hypothetical protein